MRNAIAPGFTLIELLVVIAIICLLASLILASRASQNLPDKLIVTRTHNNLGNPTAAPFSETITNTALVQKVYTDILVLPSFSSAPTSCPPDFGIQYHLEFYSGATSLLRADYGPTGCSDVLLSNGAAKYGGVSSFQTDLMQAVGFSSYRQLASFR
jgi:prepilin-type N-terminal cleavage/methylation domain-containing protein